MLSSVQACREGQRNWPPRGADNGSAGSRRGLAADPRQRLLCGPAQNGNGNVIICNCVDPRAVDRLNELLDRKDFDLKQKSAEANEWAQKHNELNAQFEGAEKQLISMGEYPILVQTEQDLLH